MADDPSKRGKQDRDRINVDQEYEVRDWAKSLGVSEGELRSAVAKAGPMGQGREGAPAAARLNFKPAVNKELIRTARLLLDESRRLTRTAQELVRKANALSQRARK